ncbi:lysophospholipid acyltransferase family protein [Marinicella litoralis]|uniref:1-acyl-sn-glycerol-3-phosphate acyltransferase n=1 Tax=Marinicella litoralis TaxID=644220 RepID=A0A4R6XJH3_9GAMM|nr:lysophospholipid acyltransferase family protein [Marinicella litoralis]TDR18499.1 1-acyl-sn-glycerol-3-phosphate acyltransferase [Marinicella litoralis]
MKQLWLYIFQIYVWLFIYPFSWTLTVLVAITISVLSIMGAAQFAGRYVARPWGKIILWITPVKLIKKGTENIAAQQSYVVVANHQSTYDILVIYGYLPLDFKWVMKIELRKVPFLGFACEKMGHIYVDRRNRQASIQAMEAAKEKLIDGTSVVFFPEGTRSSGSNILPFKKGAFRMAKDLQLPILPVTIQGADQVLASDGFFITPGQIRLTFHQPITVKEINTSSTNEIIDRAECVIASAL